MRAATLSLGLLLLVPLPLRAEVVAREGKGYLEKRDDGQLLLHLKGTPYEMGFQHGRLLGERVKTNLKRIVDNQGELGKKAEYQLYLTMRPMMHTQLRRHIPKRFTEEMRGLADGAGMSYADVEAGNLFPAAFHCSGIALKGKATRDGSLYHVRILDYLTQLGLQDAAVVIDHQPDGLKRWMNVSFSGFIGSVTGMNASQVAIGEMGGSGLGYWDGMPMPFLIRDALERAETLDEAVKIFETTPRTCEYYYVISDGKTSEAVGLWTTDKVFEVVHPGQSFAFFENMRPKLRAAGGKAFSRDVRVEVSKYSVLLQGKDGVKGFVAMPPEDTLVISGYDRYGFFMKRLDAVYGKVDEKTLMELVKRPVSMGSNLHVAIFHPATLEVWVAVAASDGSPACNQPYHRFQIGEGEARSSK